MNWNWKLKYYVVPAILGLFLGWIIHGFTPKEKINTTILQENYELKNENQKLEYEAEITKFKIKTYKHLYVLENSDSTGLDSIWTNFDF